MINVKAPKPDLALNDASTFLPKASDGRDKFYKFQQAHHSITHRLKSGLMQAWMESQSRCHFREDNSVSIVYLPSEKVSTLKGKNFVSSPREREKRDIRDSRKGERGGQGRKKNRNESEETEKIKKNSPSTLTCYKGCRPCPTVS